MGHAGQAEVLPLLDGLLLHGQMLPLPPHPSQDQATGTELQGCIKFLIPLPLGGGGGYHACHGCREEFNVEKKGKGK